MPIPICQIDAFTAAPFAGNPAAVCLLPAARPAGWMQQVAAEMNLSETAFLVAREDGYDLRWFTPMVEVDLCGHATLAAAHFLWAEGHLAPDVPARFHTRSGLLTAVRQDGWIEMDFPAQPATAVAPPPDLLAGLGAAVRCTCRNEADYLVELAAAAAVRDLQPDMAALARLQGRGIIVTARSDDDRADFVSRFFAPAVGIPEDPVTGSAHTALGPFWAERLGRSALVGYQASARGGIVRVRLAGDRVRLAGQAVTVLRGQLLD